MAVLEVALPRWYHPGNVALGALIGAGVGLALVLVARERERARAAAIDHTGSIAELRRKSWGEFETLVGEAIRREGYMVKQRGGFQRDFGADLVAERANQRVIVQCKHWLKWKVHEDAVKVLYADMKSQGFTDGWLVTCGRFTDNAISWAKDNNIRLIDGEELIRLIGSVTPSSVQSSSAPEVAMRASNRPACPNCGMSLDRLKNTYDESMFWACHGSQCGWTFDDASVGPEPSLCSHGHPMVRTATARGVPYWKCSLSSCTRKRLSADVAPGSSPVRLG